MPRTPRTFVKGHEVAHHIMSRTALQQRCLDDKDKDKFVEILAELKHFYFIEIYTFAVLDNHFHLVCQMGTGQNLKDSVLMERLEQYYTFRHLPRRITRKELPTIRERLGDLSAFVRDLKCQFTRYYNKEHDKRGYLWSERFKSVIVETGESLINCCAYVELNAVRAKLVKNPRDYPFCGLAHYDAGNPGTLITLPASEDEYLEFISATLEGKLASDLNGNHIRASNREKDILLCRCRYFTDGLVLGSKDFVESFYQDYYEHTGSRKKGSPAKLTESLYSFRRTE